MTSKPAIFVDTNIFVDVLEERLGWIESFEVINGVWGGTYGGYVSALTVTNLYFRRKRIVGKEIEARDDVWRMINGFQIIEMNATILQQSKDDIKFRDFEDAIQYYSAKSRCDTIITRNKRDFPHKDMKTLTPEEFLHH
jgi:predicted nucleic acid-binding protein